MDYQLKLTSSLLLLLLITINHQYYCLACKGCVSLDEYNFDKIIKRFKVAMVKFDVSYPYGDKHDVFTQLTNELKSHNDIVFGEVGIKDYGEHDNEKLGEQYGIKKDDLPSIRVFINNNNNNNNDNQQQTVIKFTNKDEWTLDNLRNLIRDNSDLYIGLPGCLQQYDKIAIDFINNNNDRKEQQNLLDKAEKLTQTLTNKDEEQIAQIYIKFMKKVVENDKNFIQQETERLQKILKNGKINEKKKTELGQRLNILKSFKLTTSKDEL